MSTPPTRPFTRPLADRRFRVLLWGLVGLAGWGGLVVIAWQLLRATPPKGGFDLELLLEAGRRVAAGQSPYDPGLVAGGAVQAESLFYSYPPPVAQALSFAAALPTSVVLVGWGLGATAAMVLVARALVRRPGPGGGRPASSETALALVALAPFVFPFAVALLFGNLDAWFPALYGLLLLGVLVGGRAGWGGAGVALALVALPKLHPASLAAWFAVRGLRDRRPAGPWLALAVALGVAAVIVIVSLVAWGDGPWRDYLAVVRAGSGAELIDRRNIAPAAQLAGLLGLGEGAARLLQVPVSLGAVGVTVWAAWRRSDPVESLAWAAAASLVTLPVTWFHYPVALIPFAIVAVARAGQAANGARVRGLVAGALVAAVLTIALPVAVWAAVALVLVAVRSSVPAR